MGIWHKITFFSFARALINIVRSNESERERVNSVSNHIMVHLCMRGRRFCKEIKQCLDKNEMIEQRKEDNDMGRRVNY